MPELTPTQAAGILRIEADTYRPHPDLSPPVARRFALFRAALLAGAAALEAAAEAVKRAEAERARP